MEKPSRDDLVPPGGMYVRMPIPAIKSLTYSGKRSAGRVLYALCMHLGKDNKIVFPGYPTIALFASISENNIRQALNVLISEGYISVEKRRMGRKSQNYYTILPKAYLESGSTLKPVKRFQLDPSEHWICTSCFEDVLPSDAEFVQARDYEGNLDNHWKHISCTQFYNSRRVHKAARGLLMQQDEYRDDIRRRAAERVSREDESDSL